MSTAANPRAPKTDYDNLEQEPTGAVASDSLAAESISSGGGFSENRGAVPLGVRGGQSTLANEDTSGATVLRAAADRETRSQEDEAGLGSDERGKVGPKYPDGIEGEPVTSGAIGDSGYHGGPTGSGRVTSSGAAAGASDFGASTGVGSDSSDANISSSSAKTTSGGNGPSAGVRPYVDSAPNYTATDNFRSEGTYKPKGDNLTEGDVPETKTFTGDVGGPHDPGRLAEQKFAKINAGTGGDAGIPKSTDGTTDGGQYDVLSSERA